MSIVSRIGQSLPSMNELARFFQAKLTLFVILSVGFLSFASYALPSWRPMMIPLGTALGALFSAIPGLIDQKVRVRWFYAMLGCLMVGLVTWYTTMDMSNQLDAKRDELARLQSRHQMLETDVRRYARAAGDQIILEAAKILREEWRTNILANPPEQRDFTHTNELVKLILDIDRNNGHGLYYSGEAKRKQGIIGGRHHDFYTYLGVEEHLPKEERDTSIDQEACYERPKGYCKQRTAWIEHLLATDYLAMGREETDREKKRDDFQTAIRRAHEALANFPGGFNADGQGSTKAIEREALAELNKLDQSPGP